VVVTDATSLERNLNLVLQVLEITEKVVVAVNLMDEARRKGIEVDTRSLARDLGVPAIPVSARTGEGISTLLQTIAGVVDGTTLTTPRRVQGTPEFQHAIRELVPMIESLAPGIPNARWLAIRLLDGDARVQKALLGGELPEMIARQSRIDVQHSRKMAIEGRQ
jgi:GTP-binding protein